MNIVLANPFSFVYSEKVYQLKDTQLGIYMYV
jgi:hypothetical protein